jgi:hypothetical protein
VTVPKGTLPDKYPVTISYEGDFRMGGMSAIKRSGGVDWTVEVESGGLISITSFPTILIIFVICAVVVFTVIIIKRIKSKR